MIVSIFHFHYSLAQQSDTTVVHKCVLRGSAACAVTSQENWYDSSGGAISLAASLDFKHSAKKSSRYCEQRFKGDLGFIRPENHLWNKSSDQLRLSFHYYKKPLKGWNTGYTARLNTQWLTTWKYDEEPFTSRKWYGGFMNPFAFDCSFDFSRNFLQNSRINLSLATISVSAIPVKRGLPGDQRAALTTRHSLIRSRYGCSLQLLIDEKFRNNTILLDHSSVIMANALSQDGIRVDIQNRVSFKIFRFIQLRFDTRLLYDPDFSFKMQFRQEVLLGFFYETGP